MNDTCPDPRPNRADSVMEMIAEIDGLRDHKRKQTEDIMTLGQEVGMLREALVQLNEQSAHVCQGYVIGKHDMTDAINTLGRCVVKADAALKDTSS